MKLLTLKSTDPYLNLAIEEYLFLHTDEPVFMLWQNAPSVIIGKYQNAFAEVRCAFAEQQGIRIARRITGGGAVYHDLGNVNYSFISPNEESRSLDFAFFASPILDFLASYGIDAHLSGRNDLEVDGKKISGNAQHKFGGRLLHHGTLLFDTDLNALETFLTPHREKLETRAIRSVGSRVTNLKEFFSTDITTEQFISLLSKFVETRYGAKIIQPPVSSEIDALNARNASREWIYPEGKLLSHYLDTRSRRYPFGSVEILLTMRNDTIEKIAVTGDFFGVRPIEELEEVLCKARISELQSHLASYNVSDYIFGMTEKDLLDLLQ